MTRWREEAVTPRLAERLRASAAATSVAEARRWTEWRPRRGVLERLACAVRLGWCPTTGRGSARHPQAA